MITNIKEALENVSKFSKDNNGYTQKGWYAGSGDFWVKCSDFEPAQNTGLKYIVFVDDRSRITIYQA